MPRSNKQVIIDSIIIDLEQGKSRAAVLSKIVKKCQCSDRTFDRYWKIAMQQHTEKQQAIKEAVAEVDKQAAVAARKKAIMTSEERKEYLTKLIQGQVKVPYTEVKWNPKTGKFQTIKFVELAGHSVRVSAIAELNKMEGDHAPTKVACTTKDGEDIAPLLDYSKMSVEELQELKAIHDKYAVKH
jgi:hypothetical protein